MAYDQGHRLPRPNVAIAVKGRLPAMETDDEIRSRAHAWLARLRADPDAAVQHEFLEWYGASQQRATIYDEVLAAWESAATVPLPINTNVPAPWGVTRARVVTAASAVLVLVAALILLVGNIPGGEALAETSLASRRGEIRSFVLPDGSRLTLGSDSATTVAYSSSMRHVRLDRGRARVTVAALDPRRFVVGVSRQRFAISHGVVDVAIREGKAQLSAATEPVAITALNGAGQAVAARTLRPQEQLLGGSSDAPVIIRRRADADAGWPAGVMAFEDTALGEVATALNAYGGRQIVFADRATRNLRFTGTLRATDPDSAARLLGRTFSLRVTRQGDTLRLDQPSRRSAHK